MKTHIMSCAIMLSCCFLIFGCNLSGDEESNLYGFVSEEPGGSNSAMINMTGGTVTYGSAGLFFPEGALYNPTNITLGIPQVEPTYTLPEEIEQIGYIYEAMPTGTTIGTSFSVTIGYDNAYLENYNESTLTLWIINEMDQVLEELEDVSVDAESNYVVGLADRLGFFVMTVSTEGVVTLSAPELIAPHAGAVDTPLDVTFRWESMVGALSYHMQVAADEEFASLICNEQGVSGNLHGIAGFEPSTDHYWRVKVSNIYGTSSWSEAGLFTTGDGSPSNSIEGTWEYVSGEFSYMVTESHTCFIDSWGTLVLSIGGGMFDIEGVLSFHEELYNVVLWEIEDEETYLISINEEGTYTVEDNTIPVYPYDQMLRMEITDSVDPDRIGLVEEKIFDISSDSLMLILPVTLLDNWGNGTSYYYRL
ncbi:hypothetical protein CEE37_07090 [candidate division LCP-89 bacterium B3_LCP]|uniref:Fibronectin type-III domain-containing protein n=1 Tax=candidate division LCP-89 bacterium B3_LCP TaxID=2012998 RepID=A0A532V0K6_UNCL8|nr:MAG: hypothetical protein CEE37_07090 [candidate division LCP-89 bacterium B3_LCP]